MRTILSQPPTDRIGRYPKHTFFVDSNPFVISPFMLARVLPGETLNNLYMETRSVCRGWSSPIIGAKQQYFFFYVKATDLLLNSFRDMFVDPTNTDLISSTTLEDADGNAPTYCAPGAIDFTLLALQQVTEHWFRDEGEAWNSNVHTATGLPIAQIREQTWMDSLMDEDDMPEGDAIAGATDAGDLDRLMDAYQMLRALGIANMDYSEWLRSQGITIPERDERKPELIEIWSEYQYPANTVDPATGTPVSALSWVFKKSNAKPKFFKEPGFILGVMVTRPKVYFDSLAGSLAGFATRAWDWAPNYLREMPETTLKNFAVDTGPIKAAISTDGYFVDMRDDLVHGDQFLYKIGTDSGSHDIALPDASFNWKYPTDAMLEAFSTDVVATDGFASLSVSGFEVDYTEGKFAQA